MAPFPSGTDGPPPTGEPPGDHQDLLPGWSSLVVMLMIFGALSLITMMTILRGGSTHVISESGGTKAYGPADFPEVDFDEPLLPAVLEAALANQPGIVTVPPPPFSDGIFPCSECHAEMDVDYEQRELEYAHDEIQLNHGPADRWCFDCHNADERDSLRLVNGNLVGFEESYRLCGQCHGTIYRDWREGIHGRRRGFWDGAKSYMLCAHCHDPHSPKFAGLKPLPPPVRPQLLAAEARNSSGGEPAETAEEEHP